MRILYFLLCAFLFTSCSPNKKRDTANIELEDTKGNKISMDEPANKIVCLSTPSLDAIYMLQSQDKLVGVPAEVYLDKEIYPYYNAIDNRIKNKELPSPGSNDLMNVESVIALSPDLVIAQQMPPQMINTLNNMGIAVYLSTSVSYESIMKEMKDIGKLIGKEQRADSLIDFAHKTMTELETTQDMPQDSIKTAYFTWANGRIFSTAGKNSMMSNCLELAHVNNACPASLDNPNINPETLLEWNPDMIIMWNDTPDLFYQKKELANINAIKNKQIFNLMPMYIYNTHTFKFLCAIFAINHWAYGNPENNEKEYVGNIIDVLYGKEIGNKLKVFL